MKSGATQAFVNVAIPFLSEHSDEVNKVLAELTDSSKGNRPIQSVLTVLDEMRIVHFMSMTVVDPRCPADAADQAEKKPVAQRSHLIIEMVVDGSTNVALTMLAQCMGAELKRLLDAAGVKCDVDADADADAVAVARAIASLLTRHRIVIRDTWRGTLGQVFNGSPGQSVQRIKWEQRIANRIGNEIEMLRRGKDWSLQTPRERLDRIRSCLWDTDGEAASAESSTSSRLSDKISINANEMKWTFMPEPTPCLGPKPDDKIAPSNPQIWKVGLTIFHKFGWPIYTAAGLLAFAVYWLFHGGQAPTVEVMWGAFMLGVFVASLLVIVIAGFQRLRWLENRDDVDDRTPSAANVEELLKVENFTAQNHLASVSRLKQPYWFRKLILRIAFVVVGTGRFVGKPGFLGKNGVIHFARWMLLPRTNQMLFLSNFDGTWAAYVGDFIADAPTGVTAIWSNCYGFPRTKRLFSEGAQDRDRLVRWARRQQHPTRFWYQAYPDLTAERIRINAAIRQGIASAQSEADAEDWLAQFGSMVSPHDLLKMSEIPILVFGGLSNMRHATTYVIRFDPDKEACKAWLKQAAEAAAYGEMLPGQPSAVVVALTCSGLAKLGVPAEALATFPTSFQQGMATAWRARVLADLGNSAPENWAWGKPGEDVDAVVTVYGVEAANMQAAWTPLETLLRLEGHSVAAEIPMKELPLKPDASKPATETANENAGLVPMSSSADEGAAPDRVSAEPAPSPSLAHAEGAPERTEADPAPAYSTIDQGSAPERKSADPAPSSSKSGKKEKVSPTSWRVREPFGFADGVSQPVLRGTPRSHAHVDSDHMIDTGEIVLGYPDNLKKFPPSPTIAGEYDPDRQLPDELTDDPLKRNRPEFARYRGTGRRDLGANGTFLVVRQLEQDVALFNSYVRLAAKEAASGKHGIVVAIDSTGAIAILGGAQDVLTSKAWAALSRSSDQANAGGGAVPPRRPAAKILSPTSPPTEVELEQLAEYIAARMVGRWKNGTSLVRNPQRPGTLADANALPDNDFRFGGEDPRGLGCPFGAHIRRANPRDTRFPGIPEEIVETNRHRVLRVGRSYESKAGAGSEKKTEGLMFMCLNADIERQFEFVQKSWLMIPTFMDSRTSQTR